MKSKCKVSQNEASLGQIGNIRVFYCVFYGFGPILKSIQPLGRHAGGNLILKTHQQYAHDLTFLKRLSLKHLFFFYFIDFISFSTKFESWLST